MSTSIFAKILPLLPSEKNEFLLTIFAIFGAFPQRNLGLKCPDEASIFCQTLPLLPSEKNEFFLTIFAIFGAFPQRNLGLN